MSYCLREYIILHNFLNLLNNVIFLNNSILIPLVIYCYT